MMTISMDNIVSKCITRIYQMIATVREIGRNIVLCPSRSF